MSNCDRRVKKHSLSTHAPLPAGTQREDHVQAQLAAEAVSSTQLPQGLLQVQVFPEVQAQLDCICPSGSGLTHALVRLCRAWRHYWGT